MVYLMIGHTYKKLGNTPQAMIHYSWAMELDPKGANTHLRDIMANPPITMMQAGNHHHHNQVSSQSEDLADRIFEIQDDLLSGLLSPGTTTRAPQTGVRRLTDFSLLYGAEGSEEDPAFSDADLEHYDTMDINSVDNTSNANSMRE